LKKKKVEVQSIPARAEERTQEFDDNIVALDLKIKGIMSNKEPYTLVFLDETVFKQRDFARRAWSLPNMNHTVHDRTQY